MKLNQFVDTGEDLLTLSTCSSDEVIEKALNKQGLVQIPVQVNSKKGVFIRKQWVRASDLKNFKKKNGVFIPKDNKSYSEDRDDIQQHKHNKAHGAHHKKEESLKEESLEVNSSIRGNKEESASENHAHQSQEDKKKVFHKEENDNSKSMKILYLSLDTCSTPGKKAEAFDNHQVYSLFKKAREEGKTKENFVEFKEHHFYIDKTDKAHHISTTTDKVYKKNGKYTEQRQKLHDAIVKAIVDQANTPPEGVKPVAYLYGGGSASGKSSVANSIAEPMMKALGIVPGHIDSDEIKKSMPEYLQFMESNKDMGAAKVHDESSDIANEALDALISQGKNLIFDGTMKNYQKYIGMTKRLHEAGYEVRIVGADIPLADALKRSDARAEKTGRRVPHSIIEGSHGGFALTLPKLIKEVDSVMLFDNSQPFGEPPTLIYDDDGVQNEELWNRFVKKGQDYIKAKEARKKGGK